MGESIDQSLGENMKKQDLLKYVNGELLDKLFGFCYARTNDSYAAEELCSDIVFALVKSARSGGEIESVYPFVWKVARNVYADYSEKRKRESDLQYEGDAEEFLLSVAEDDETDETGELLTAVYHRIAYLTEAYREAMILFYIDGLSTAQIAVRQNTSESNVRQRLFSARQKIKSEVTQMADTSSKPVALDRVDYVLIGTGNPGWGDPREGFIRQFSKHIVWLCRKKPMSACEIAEELNVPTVYVEQELEILEYGANGKYGLLRRLDNGRYAINIILLDKETAEKVHAIYTEGMPGVCDIIADYIQAHKEEYLSFPYLNRRVDLNLILWQQIRNLFDSFEKNVERILEKDSFAGIEKPDRPFSVFGYEYYGLQNNGCGWDGIDAQNVCGFRNVHLDNIYFSRIREHFHCGHNVSNDPLIQLALRSIDGLAVSTLSETEKEHAAKAIECGYLYREDNTLFTKILVSSQKDGEDLYKISRGLENGYLEAEAEIAAKKLAAVFKKAIPAHLLGEWRLANLLATAPVFDAVVDRLIDKGILSAPENGVGAEGCWMIVEK
jgi:RNA polymerase sigma factor (sigma-70 family)